MEERKEEDFDQEFNDEELDLTEDAFFSDLTDMEEEIATEAYELVEHAINLIDSQYYDDSVEILRQAIGLYTQINRTEEIKAINDKISEVYMLKEKAFRETEEISEKVVEVKDKSDLIEGVQIIKEIEASEEDEVIKGSVLIEEANLEDNLINNANELIVQAHELSNINMFEEALDKYDEAEKILQELGKFNEIERLYSLIEECYDKKAEYLRSFKKEETKGIIELDATLRKELEKEKKLQQFLDAKKHEEKVSSNAYELLDQAVELAKMHEYDKAIKLYTESANLFEELNWSYEAKRIRETIEQLKQEKVKYIKELEKERAKIEQKIETEIYKEKLADQHFKEISEHERIAKMERMRGIEIQKMEQEFLKVQIDNMATEASRMAREYELAMKKAIKKGSIVEECIYPEVIEIYKKIKELLIDKGWNTEAAIYDDTINVYIQKHEQDKKIREIEADKKRKLDEVDELLKIKEKDLDVAIDEKKQLALMEEQRQKQLELQKIRSQIEEKTNRAERLSREYEIALRQGKFELKCPYPEIINLFEEAKKIALERGWETEVAIFSSQIYSFKQKLEKDNRLRQIEAEKVKKQEEIEELLKVKEKPVIGIDAEKLELLREQRMMEKEKKDFDRTIDLMINRAESMAREYELSMKKAIKKGKLTENPPFLKIIGIYEQVKRMLLDKERGEEAARYGNQINYYTQKLEQDNKLREIEAKKVQREKELEEIHKIGKEIGVDEKKLRIIKRKKEEEDFEKEISDNVNIAEKMVRDYEIQRRRAYRKGKILESTPYGEVIKIYKQIQKKVYARGWREQAEVFANQIKIYQEKLENHKKLLETEVQKAQREQALEEMHKIQKLPEVDQKKLTSIQLKKEEQEFQKYITEIVNKAERLEREYNSAMKKAIKKGEVLEKTPYLEIIDIYSHIKNKLEQKGWIEQSLIYSNQIKIYQEKLDKHNKLIEIEAIKAQREKEIEEMHKMGGRKILSAQPEKVKEIKAEEKEENIKLDKALNLIDEAEKAVKAYELSIRKDILLYESPYDNAISNYEKAREIFQEIGWKEEASRIINTIKFYKDKKEKDEKLREIEQKKLEEPKIELKAVDIQPDKDFLDRQKRFLEIKQKEKESDKITAKIFNMIQNAERMAQEYELKIKEGIFDFEAPYEKIIEIYKEARKRFEEIDWKDESAKLKNTINFYKDKLAKDKKIRALESQKVRKREEELLLQQKLLEEARIEQEKLIQKRKESLDFKQERVAQFETEKDKAFRLMDQAKRELRENHFDKAIEFYQESEKIFISINWQEGIKMVRESVAMITNKKKEFEREQQKIEEQKIEKLLSEKKLEEKLAETQILRRQQQEEKRKEFLRIQQEKERERQVSEEAYKFLEEGTALMDLGKFIEAHEKFITARELFEKISWQREVSRINNELLFKLKREQKQAEILKQIKLKKIEEEKQMALLKEEVKREREEEAKRQKQEKRRFVKEETLRKISAKLDKASKLIEEFQYNEGILMMMEEIQRLKNLGRNEEILKINAQVESIKKVAGIPIIVLDIPEDDIQNKDFKAAYKALDNAQGALAENQIKRAISELKEANFQLNNLKIGKKFEIEIDKKINELREFLGLKPIKKKVKISSADEAAKLRARIAARREERRKKVIDLLKKDRE